MGPTTTIITTTARDISGDSFQATTPTEEEENNDNIINNSEMVAMVVVAGANKKKEEEEEEEEEREKKEDFVKAVDELLEYVTKKFSRISRDMLGKSTSIYHPYFCFFLSIFHPPSMEGGGFVASFFFSLCLFPDFFSFLFFPFG